METKTIEGAILDIDYLNKSAGSQLRIIIKGRDGKRYEIFDLDFKPYFYLVASKEVEQDLIEGVSAFENGKTIQATKIEKSELSIFGKKVIAHKIFVRNTSDVQKLSSAMAQYGTCYEYDIPFAKRYSVDKEIVPLTYYKINIEENDGILSLKSFGEKIDDSLVDLNLMCFDIEVYNPIGGMPRFEKDPIIMISYLYTKNKERKQGVITLKKIDLPFVEFVKDERTMIKKFIEKVSELDVTTY